MREEPPHSRENRGPTQVPDWVRLPGRIGNALVAIITIVEEEYVAVRGRGDFNVLVGNTPYLRRNEIFPGVYDVVLAKSTDRSNTACSELVRNIAEFFRPEFIILSGIAGGVAGRDGVALGDVVVADHVDWYEMRKIAGGRDVIRKQAFDPPSMYLRETITQRVKIAGYWLTRVGNGRPVDRQPKVLEGNLIAGDKILGDRENEYQRKISTRRWPSTWNLTVSLAGCITRGVRDTTILTILLFGNSDLVDAQGNDAQRRLWREYAAATAAAFALCVADEIVALCG